MRLADRQVEQFYRNKRDAADHIDRLRPPRVRQS